MLIMNLRMADINGPDLAPLIKRKSPATAFMVLSSISEDQMVIRAINAGISGYLLKETDIDNLAVLVRVVSYGGCYISTPIIYRIFNTISGLDKLSGSAEDFLNYQNEKARIFREFSPTERSIIISLAQGYLDEEIADQLHITPATVRNCLCVIRRKTGLQSRTQIAIYALIYGLTVLDKMNFLKKSIDRLALIPYNKQNGGSYANGMRSRSGNPELQAGHLRL
jgi:DNA-binding NarL/FixJ family response regulator